MCDRIVIFDQFGLDPDEAWLVKEKIRFALSVKPKRHDFIINSETKPYINRLMNETGG